MLDALSSLERHEEAIALSQKVQRALEKERGSDDPEVLIQLSNQAQLYELLDRLEDAELLWRRCLQGHEQRLDSNDDALLRCLHGLAQALLQLDRPAEAEPLYRRCLSGVEASRGPEHPDTLRMVYDLAETLTALERFREAIPLRRRELAWCRSTNDPDTFWSVQKLATDLSAVGELEECETLLREALAGFERVLDPSDSIIGDMLRDVATVLDDRGNLEEAIAFGERAIQHFQLHRGSDNWHTNAERLVQAQLLISDERQTQAAALLDAVLNSLAAKKDADDDDQTVLQTARELRQSMGERQASEPESPA